MLELLHFKDKKKNAHFFKAQLLFSHDINTNPLPFAQLCFPTFGWHIWKREILGSSFTPSSLESTFFLIFWEILNVT